MERGEGRERRGERTEKGEEREERERREGREKGEERGERRDGVKAVSEGETSYHHHRTFHSRRPHNPPV